MIKLGLLLLVVPCVFLMGGYMYELSMVEECRQSGGVYDYIQQSCMTSGNYPFVPYMVRHPLVVNGGMLVSVVGLFICIAGLYKRAA